MTTLAEAEHKLRMEPIRIGSEGCVTFLSIEHALLGTLAVVYLTLDSL